jgi:hypothetical protein
LDLETASRMIRVIYNPYEQTTHALWIQSFDSKRADISCEIVSNTEADGGTSCINE